MSIVYFNASALIGNKDAANMFNYSVAAGLFDHEYTYNSVVVDVASEIDPECALWDATVSLDTENGLVVVTGSQYCSGRGATVTLSFNDQNELVQYSVNGKIDNPSFFSMIHTFKIQQIYVEPITEETDSHIRKIFKDCVM